MIVDLLAVRLDGSSPPPGQTARVQKVQAIQWPRGFSGQVRVTCKNEDGTTTDISATKARLTLRRARADTSPALCLEVTASTVFDLTTANADKAEGRYQYDVVLIDNVGGKRWQIVPGGPWEFTVSPSDADDAVTP